MIQSQCFVLRIHTFRSQKCCFSTPSSSKKTFFFFFFFGKGDGGREGGEIYGIMINLENMLVFEEYMIEKARNR